MDVLTIDLDLESSVAAMPLLPALLNAALDPPLEPNRRVRSLRAPTLRPVIRSFRFPDPAMPEPPWTPRAAGSERKKETAQPPPASDTPDPDAVAGDSAAAPPGTGVQLANGPSPPPAGTATGSRPTPAGEALSLRDRLYYTLLPSIEAWLANGAVHLPAEPFPYQSQGIAFLLPRTAALLGDEMGLGKTMQAIVAVRLLLGSHGARRVLIVCPKPLVANWCREFRHWAADVPIQVIEGSTARRQALWQLPQAPVRIVNYELMVRDCDFVAEENLEFDLVILDEAQRIKNEESQTARAVRRIKRRRSWAMSGTPIENSPLDLVSIFKFVEPHLIHGQPSHAELREATQPYIIRRCKEHVLTQLPPKIIRDAHLDLSPAQRATYDTAEQDGVLRLNEMGSGITLQNVFELILRLKQICNFDPPTGESAKLDQLRGDLEEVAASGRKAVVFSQWVATLDRLADALGEYRPLMYHGGIPSSQRMPILDRFKADPNRHVLLISYGAGAVGLNLQFAQYLFLFDRWWNPAVEDQAINRVHRIGQKEPVFITRFLATNTIEDRIADVLDQKRSLASEILPAHDVKGPSMGLKAEDIFRLFNIRVRPKKHPQSPEAMAA